MGKVKLTLLSNLNTSELKTNILPPMLEKVIRAGYPMYPYSLSDDDRNVQFIGAVTLVPIGKKKTFGFIYEVESDDDDRYLSDWLSSDDSTLLISALAPYMDEIKVLPSNKINRLRKFLRHLMRTSSRR